MTQMWSIEASRSQAQFWSHPRLLPRSGGQFQALAGEMIGSPQDGWRVQVRVDARSLKFQGPRWMERLTRSDAFLAVERHPDIRFESALFSDAMLHSGGELEGQLTLRGRTRTVRLALQPSRCELGQGSCLFQVHGQVNRHNFGMSAYRLTLRDEVDIEFRVQLRPGVTP
jgi:polyisoprenoid-binding protein YceI